ncbi:uncharacterized protein TRAVEDRAFT_48147 [Trametes versicolor FP-101664 SS1]|uniref:uncharacterized protein n=1 Tax=Trametes versicolor (strain FP-101664) TaxID=717944 RepID=UPI00046236B6|nr:uncharacterized protein TRAVEDRAFT_48147 [Trametes versicolor FP-101664 SS1]EIW59020.1 hypothetical protein TRAVEDRAFT_48147 [Trametes versicolor FP-101664 SS1]
MAQTSDPQIELATSPSPPSPSDSPVAEHATVEVQSESSHAIPKAGEGDSDAPGTGRVAVPQGSGGTPKDSKHRFFSRKKKTVK